MSNDDPKPPIQTPKYMATPPPAMAPAGPTSIADTFIPSKNTSALLAYYLGLFSIAPLIGLPMGVIAFINGRKGLAAYKADPQIQGSAHAKVGIGCGAIGFLFNLALVLLFLAILIFGTKKPGSS